MTAGFGENKSDEIKKKLKNSQDEKTSLRSDPNQSLKNKILDQYGGIDTPMTP